MNDLLSEMASDSGATADKIDQLEEGKLDSVSRLAKEAAELEYKLAEAGKLVKETKAALHKITDEHLPEALEAMGLQKFTLTDGSEIAVKPIYLLSRFCKRCPTNWTNLMTLRRVTFTTPSQRTLSKVKTASESLIARIAYSTLSGSRVELVREHPMPFMEREIKYLQLNEETTTRIML